MYRKRARTETFVISQVVDSAERVSEGDSLHAVGVRKRETRYEKYVYTRSLLHAHQLRLISRLLRCQYDE
jgi:hypothetical protein